MKCTNLENIISLFSGENVDGYFMSIHEVNIKYYLFGLFLLALLRINKFKFKFSSSRIYLVKIHAVFMAKLNL